VREEVPESVAYLKRSLDRELREVVRQIASGCHCRTLKWPTMQRRSNPAAQATLVIFIELDAHDHWCVFVKEKLGRQVTARAELTVMLT
jgi:hypothetical protein